MGSRVGMWRAGYWVWHDLQGFSRNVCCHAIGFRINFAGCTGKTGVIDNPLQISCYKDNFCGQIPTLPFMRIDILTLFPDMFGGFLSESILKRASQKGLAEIYIHNIRDFSNDKHKRVDDYAFGGGAGMVMMAEPIHNALKALQSERKYDLVIYTSPDGEIFDQKKANRLSGLHNMIILCGHYKGVDERVREHLIDMEISIGNFVLTGGELAAAVIADATIRLLPGVLNDETSALSDSFQDNLLSPPVYTRPFDYNGWKVPEVLISGHERKISEWRLEKSIERTLHRRPGLMEGYPE